MLNFTVGPVQTYDYIRNIGFEQVPYFRTAEFSSLMIENEELMLEFSKAPLNSKCVFITGSGTASMEATVANTLSPDDKVLVINGGGFGQRFVELLNIFAVPYDEIKMDQGKNITEEMLRPYNNCGYTAFVVNMHETSTGVLYDMSIIGDFCNKNNLFLIVDAISSFLADPISMTSMHIDVLLTGSQKALACHPGVSIIVLSPRAIARVHDSNVRSLYFNLKIALDNQKRGQTPFTPAVNILMQIHERLKTIQINGGIEKEISRIKELAFYFRDEISDLPLQIASESLSNAMTPLHPTSVSAMRLFEILKSEYNIWVCPNGGDLKDTLFRVGHIGCLTKNDYDQLISAFYDLRDRNII